MSSTILSQTELDAYLSALDLGDANISRVLNAIQLLTPRIYNDVLYYMVMGKITLNQLSLISINNLSVKGLIAAAVAGGETTLSKVRILENYFTSIPNWNDLCNTTSSIFFSRIFNPSKNLTAKCILDETGIDKTAYQYKYQVMDAYYKVINNAIYSNYPAISLIKTAERISLENILNSNGLNNLLVMMDKEILAGSLVCTADLKIVPSLDATTTLCGFVLRDLHNEPWRINFTDNMAFIYNWMAEGYDLETIHTGSLGLKNAMLLQWNTWNYVKTTSTTSSVFIELLAKVSLLRLAVPNVYGTTEFTSLELSNENTEFLKFKDSLEAIKVYLKNLIQNIEVIPVP